MFLGILMILELIHFVSWHINEFGAYPFRIWAYKEVWSLSMCLWENPLVLDILRVLKHINKFSSI